MKKLNRRLSALILSALLCQPALSLVSDAKEKEKPKPTLLGDVNGDGRFDANDFMCIHHWILGNYDEMSAPENADFNEDGVVDAFDMAAMQRELVDMLAISSPAYGSQNLSAPYSLNVAEGLDPDKEFILGQTEFALGFFQRCVDGESNVVVSPYSAVQALGMTTNGADGKTKKQMENVIGGLDIESLDRYLLTQRLSQPNGRKSNCALSTANSVWTKYGQEVKKDFLYNAATYYGADCFSAPFDDSTVDDINRWVNGNTNGMIPKLIDELEDNCVMALINAVAFEAQWAKSFDSECEGEFAASDGTKQKAEMLSSVENSYIFDDKAEGFLKYYDGRRYAFAAILPNEGVSLESYISGLTPESLNKLLSSSEKKEVAVGVPKFSYDFKIKMNDLLADMGMPDAFDFSKADFSKIDGTKELFISLVLQQAHIELDKNGTKAAAATIVEISKNGMSAAPDKKIVLDRPFMYCIVDTETSLPIFMGAVNSLK